MSGICFTLLILSFFDSVSSLFGCFFFACLLCPFADIDRKFSNLAVSSDVPGPILARADGTAAPYDEDTSPGFGIDVIVHDAVMQYGPWADRQRYALMQLRVQANS
jgi:hypothetical protein